MEEKNNKTLGKINFILMAVGFIIIVIGFALMAGGSYDGKFNPDIFSNMRINVAPLVSFFGFVFIIFAILYKPKHNDKA